MMKQLTGAQIVLECLKEQGVDTVFGYPGGAILNVYDELYKHRNEIRHVLTSHEQGASHAADGYARSTGKVGVCFATSGPGATNTLTGVMGAWQDSIPMIVLSGQVRYEISVAKSGLNLRYRGIQEFEIVPTVKNMTKYAVMITDPKAIRRELMKAINIAMDGRRGPVWLDIPQDIQNARVDVDDLYDVENFVSSVPEVDNEKIAYLTFDDGPSTVTPTILQTLNEKGVKATFFVLGSNAEHMPDMVKQMYEQGHYIANHGYSHVYSTIYSSPEMVLEEFNKCNNAVRNAIGEPEYNSHLFRFPGGSNGGKYNDLKQGAKQLLSDNDILSVDWNSLSGDAEKQNPTPEYLMERMKSTSQDKSSLVILMHDAQAKKVTADTLPEIISYLKEQGYEFKSFYDIIK